MRWLGSRRRWCRASGESLGVCSVGGGGGGGKGKASKLLGALCTTPMMILYFYSTKGLTHGDGTKKAGNTLQKRGSAARQVAGNGRRGTRDDTCRDRSTSQQPVSQGQAPGSRPWPCFAPPANWNDESAIGQDRPPCLLVVCARFGHFHQQSLLYNECASYVPLVIVA